MLNPEEQTAYESHMSVCGECRSRSFLLDNLARVIKSQEVPAPVLGTTQVAARAYEKCGSWDVFLLSWLRPAAAWSGLALLVVLLSFLWGLPAARQTGAGGEYETLMNQIDPSNTGTNASATLTDDKLELWLEQGGAIQ
jgi:hypothetical protein